jgi:ferredoxin
MAKYRLEFDKKTCIGTFSCVAVASNFFEQGKENKSNLLGGILHDKEKEIYYLEFEAEEDSEALRKAKNAAQVCPVFAIVVRNLETGKIVAGGLIGKN